MPIDIDVHRLHFSWPFGHLRSKDLLMDLLICPKQPLEACFTVSIISGFIFLFSGTVSISKK